jgi:diguanylate cyclase (GGDEF)-like protein/PAS domain S-box-containing protein
VDKVEKSLKKVLTGTQEKDLETLFKHRDGSVGYLLWNFNCLLGEDQKPLGIIAVGQDLTGWKRSEQERLNVEAMAEMAQLSVRIATDTIDGMMDAVLIMNLDGKIIQYNHGFEESFGWGREVLGNALSNYVEGVEVQKVLEEIIQGRSGRDRLKNLDCQVITRDHRKVPALINATLQKGSEGTQDKVITVIRDITERKHYEEALQEKSAEMSVLYGVSAALAVSINPEEIFAKLFNTFSELEMVNAMKMGHLFVVDDGFLRLVPHPRHSQEFVELHRNLKVGECLCGLAAQQGEFVICQDCADDERAIMRCHDGVCHGHVFLPLKNMEEVKGVLAFTCSDQFQMDENKEKILRTIGGLIGVALDNASLHEKSRVLSLSDPLTGIANRRLLDMMLDRSLARSKRCGEPLSVVMVDIDHFKRFNDTRGHVEGDRLLCQVASLIAREIRQTDLVARYGGEEFLIMLPDANLDNASNKAERIRKMIAETTKVTISLGVASYQDGIKNKEDLINRADKALYAAKDAGRNQVKRMDEDNENRSTSEHQTAD